MAKSSLARGSRSFFSHVAEVGERARSPSPSRRPGASAAPASLTAANACTVSLLAGSRCSPGSSSSASSIEIFGDVRRGSAARRRGAPGSASSRAITERQPLRQRREVALHDEVDGVDAVAAVDARAALPLAHVLVGRRGVDSLSSRIDSRSTASSRESDLASTAAKRSRQPWRAAMRFFTAAGEKSVSSLS